MEAGRISDHGFLADGRTAVLVDRAASVNWWCPARFDAPSVFCRLLDSGGGHWEIRPDEDFTSERVYLDDTLVLRTVFTTRHGSVAVTDALALEPGARGHEIGLRSPGVLGRVVQGLSGEVPMRLHYKPRFEYGLVTAYLVERDGALEATAGADRLRLRGDVPMVCGEGEATATFTVPAETTLRFTLAYSPTYDGGAPAELDAEELVANAVEGWRSWAGLHDDYRGRYRDQVRRSAMVVQAMTYQPSGAVIAAPTTSLPEELGGQRNYDYRFVWVRDFSLTLQALWRAACPHEADRQFAWASRAMGRIGNEPAPIMYAVDGQHDLTERRLDHLRGYAESRPVYVGNDAWRQRQTDVLGEVLDAAWLMRHYLDPMSPEVRNLLRELADQAAMVWRRPDAGMWEARDAERHYVSSKVQCWTALDRAVRHGTRLGDSADVARWAAARDEVRDAVLTRGWNERLGAYTGAFDSENLDASVLIMPLVGFLPADDPRMRSTMRVVEQKLSHNGLLRRWDGDPAGFVICSFWLVGCLALVGEVDRAGELFEQLAARTNDLGLYAEQIDPTTGEQLGNFPQAFSHIGLINAAGQLTEADERRRGTAQQAQELAPAGAKGTKGARSSADGSTAGPP
ncbi:glycoside hydrolase family 15 protein [Phytohabitans flavus]|uniref:Glucoamylase n=1 Tax=Phytohabitans flavus TaxID=1076124 RepID=A0A6F8XMB0_9ACTN|nr:glycoside hydrolase family 15 protein [Phytohabitans flavus]BCB74945.1 glucoamylase [Phytohabitans flavus]